MISRTTKISLEQDTPALHNCRTCALGGPLGQDCDALTLDEEIDRPILDWLGAVGVGDDGSVPPSCDGCPKWETCR